MSKEEKKERPAHAKLSASGSERWINCSGSYQAEKNLPNKSSKFADEGSLAHDIAAKCLENDLDALDFINYKAFGHTVDVSMANYVNEYCEYVRSFKGTLYTEKTVDFSHVVPEGFGTADALVFDKEKRHLHVIDLKFGMGVPVRAFENTQGILYALGALYDYKNLFYVDHVSIHIVQPRIKNYSEWKIKVTEIHSYWHPYLSKKAHEALDPHAKKTPSDKACKWCKAKPKCEELYKFTKSALSTEIEDLGLLKIKDSKELSKEKTKELLDKRDLIVSFLDKVKEDVQDRMLKGEKVEGYKLVAGKVNRKFTEDAEHVIVEKLGSEKAYEKKLISLTIAEKLLGKDIISEITYKPEAPIVMVHEEDKREAVGDIKYFEDLT